MEVDACELFQPHETRDLCRGCKHSKAEHPADPKDVEEVYEALGKIDKDFQPPPKDNTYAWTPPKCPNERLEEYFESFDPKKVPKIGSIGAEWRMKQIARQIPLSDVSEKHCRFVEPECQDDLESHLKQIRASIRFGFVKVWETGMPLQCPGCLNLLEEGDLVVVSSDAGEAAHHPGCLACGACKETPADLVHCVAEDGGFFCVRDFSETLKKRCRSCAELIFAQRYSHAREQHYHADHLCCLACDRKLESNKGFERDEELYCGECYERLFCRDCSACGGKIGLDSRHVSYEDKNFHYNCFVCHSCKSVITDFDVHESNYYCLKCYNEAFAPRCTECDKLFEGECRIVKYEERPYHLECFKCTDCKAALGAGSFIPHGDKVYCKPCYLRSYGVRCFKCKYTITDEQGLMYNKQPYHAECFTCSKCNAQLDSGPFRNVEEELFCIGCFGRGFCKKCHSCGEPILLDDNDVMYTHEDYHWHNDCFTCKSCNKKLGETPFAIRGAKLICKECSSQSTTQLQTARTGI